MPWLLVEPQQTHDAASLTRPSGRSSSRLLMVNRGTRETRGRLQIVLAEASPPPTLPHFDALLIDPNDNAAWARLYSRSQSAEWVRLGEGRGGRSRFSLPKNVAVLDVSKTHLLGLRRNNDGTEDVIVYEFHK